MSINSILSGLTSSVSNALGSAISGVTGVGGNLMSAGKSGDGSRDPNGPSLNYTVTITQQKTDAFPMVRNVKGHMPEEFTMSSRSEYDTPFADSIVPNRKLALLAQVAGWAPTVQAMTAQFWKGSSPIEISFPLVITAYSGPEDITNVLMALKTMERPTKDRTTGFLRAPGPQLKFNKQAATKTLTDGKEAAGLFGAVGMSEITGKGGIVGNGKSVTYADANAVAAPLLDQADALSRKSADLANDVGSLIQVSGKISIAMGNMLFFEDVIINDVSENYNVVLTPQGKVHKVTVNIAATTRLTPTYEDYAKIYMITDPFSSSLPGAIK